MHILSILSRSARPALPLFFSTMWLACGAAPEPSGPPAEESGIGEISSSLGKDHTDPTNNRFQCVSWCIDICCGNPCGTERIQEPAILQCSVQCAKEFCEDTWSRPKLPLPIEPAPRKANIP